MILVKLPFHISITCIHHVKIGEWKEKREQKKEKKGTTKEKTIISTTKSHPS